MSVRYRILIGRVSNHENDFIRATPRLIRILDGGVPHPKLKDFPPQRLIDLAVHGNESVLAISQHDLLNPHEIRRFVAKTRVFQRARLTLPRRSTREKP